MIAGLVRWITKSRRGTRGFACSSGAPCCLFRQDEGAGRALTSSSEAPSSVLGNGLLTARITIVSALPVVSTPSIVAIFCEDAAEECEAGELGVQDLGFEYVRPELLQTGWAKAADEVTLAVCRCIRLFTLTGPVSNPADIEGGFGFGDGAGPRPPLATDR